MKTNYDKTSQTFGLAELTEEEYSALCLVLKAANDSCFKECDSDGCWYSNADFVCKLDDGEREALRGVCRGL
jgi:hypothetical protein